MIPTVPIGATIDSLLLAISRVDDSTSPAGASRRFYGTRRQSANPFARNAATLSATAFAGLISPEQLILNHSAWPVYSSLVSRRSAQAWFQRTRDGASSQIVPEVHSPVQSELFASRWKSCASCVSFHRHKYGTGHWMVIHQLPGISHCPTHGEPLDVECGVCGAALGGAGLDRLPGEPCTKCGGKIARRIQIDQSVGARQLANLYAALLGGQALELDVRSRELILGSADCVLSSSQESRSLEQHFLSAFNCQDAEDIGAYLKAAVSAKMLRLALSGKSTNAVPAPLHLAVLAVAKARLEQDACLNESGLGGVDLRCIYQGVVDRFDLPAEDLEEILERAADCNISPAAVTAWLSGDAATLIERQGLTTVSRLKGFARSLPEHLAARLPTILSKGVEIVRRGATQEERRSANRDHIQRSIAAGARNRSLLLASCQASYKWALKFDREWLDTHLPAWNRSRSK